MNTGCGVCSLTVTRCGLPVCVCVWVCVRADGRTPGTDLSIDDQCLLSLLKGLCLKHLGHQEEAEHYFTLVLCK